MKRILFIILAVSILIPLKGWAGEIVILSPAKGAVWHPGHTYKIKWEKLPFCTSYEIRLQTFSVFNSSQPVKEQALNTQEVSCQESSSPLRQCNKWTIDAGEIETGPFLFYRIFITATCYPGGPGGPSEWTGHSGTFDIRGPQINSDAIVHLPKINFPDLTISDYKVEILQPGQEDHAGKANNDLRIQIKLTVKNIGQEKADSEATLLRIRGIADGNAPLPPEWTSDGGNYKHKDIQLGILDPGESTDAYEVFAIPIGSVQFRFSAMVNPDHKGREMVYTNNQRLFHFAPLETIPDLAVTGFEGKLLAPDQPDHSGHVDVNGRVQLHWTVKNVGQGAAPYQAAVLRVRGMADGSVPLPIPPWEWDGNQVRMDFPMLGLAPGQLRDVWAVFAVPDGSIKYRFNAQVNPDHLGGEINYANNGRLSTFVPLFTGMPPAPLFMPLTLSPSTLVVSSYIGGTATFTIKGGKPPYQVSASDPSYMPSASSVTKTGGAFSVAVPAGAVAKTITYTVKDADNHTAAAILSIVLSQQGGPNTPVFKKHISAPGAEHAAVTMVPLPGGGVFRGGKQVTLKFRHAASVRGFHYEFQHRVKGRWAAARTPRVLRTLTSKSGAGAVTTLHVQLAAPGDYRWRCRPGNGPWSKWQTFTLKGNAAPRENMRQTAIKTKSGGAALKITPPVITSLKRGQTFTAPARLKLTSRYASGRKITYELQKRDNSGRFRTLKTSSSGDFGNLGPGVYRVRACYVKKNLPAGTWHEFTVRAKPALRKLNAPTSGGKPVRMHVPRVK